MKEDFFMALWLVQIAAMLAALYALVKYGGAL